MPSLNQKPTRREKHLGQRQGKQNCASRKAEIFLEMISE
jgi:hypothetical protein